MRYPTWRILQASNTYVCLELAVLDRDLNNLLEKCEALESELERTGILRRKICGCTVTQYDKSNMETRFKFKDWEVIMRKHG